MGRRRRRNDPVELLLELMGPLLALGLLLAFFAPRILSAILALLMMAVIVAACGVAAVIAFLIIRAVLRRRREAQSPLESFASAPRVQPAKPLAYLNPFESILRSEWGLEKSKQAREPSLEEKLRAVDWYQFEKVVSAIYEIRGCSVKRLGGAKPDGGIDLIAEKDGERTIVQCKHWRNRPVKVREVRELLGSMTDANIKNGVLATLRGCTQDARELARKHGIEIVDESQLAKLVETTDGSIHSQIAALLNDTRKFCPNCESELVLRTARRGFYFGRSFWSCSKYPRCQYKRDA